MVQAVGLAIEMAKQSYPHLVEELEHAEQIWRKDALSFIGSEKIPASAHPAYKEGKK